MEPSIQNYRHGGTLPTLFASVGAEPGEYGLRAACDLGTMRSTLRQPSTARNTTGRLAEPTARPDANLRGTTPRKFDEANVR
jgi:hypothetical protein